MIAKTRRARPAPQTRRAKAARRPHTDGKRQELSEDRRQVLISEAARLFGNKGYENTSMRDIAAAVGILPGSLYHHFPSKEELFTAVYSFAVAQSRDAVKMAQTGRVDPWARLEAVCIAHMQGLLDKNRFAAVLVSHPLADRLPEEVITLRDRYEAVFKDLIAELPLPAGTDRRIFRLGLLGAMNWAISWYRPGGETPASIALKLLKAVRHG
jgi:AcrR family transcriptional regulator